MRLGAPFVLRDNVFTDFPLLWQGSIYNARKREVSTMFLILAIVLFALWIGGFLVFKTAGILIHLLLLLAVISLVMNFVSGKRAV